MRLLNTRTMKLEYFMDDRKVAGKYAILSHTWGEEEVSFEEFDLKSSNWKEGYRKIRGAVKQALEDNMDYLWCDTCCIDKRSSAELSEAINSMYRWYYEAEVCYAYLCDLDTAIVQDFHGFAVQLEGDAHAFASQLARCRWFTRGWTLQELIAPREVILFNASWIAVARKSQIASTLSDITCIDRDILVDRDRLQDASVAKRMSFAACRQTTRLEDEAYSLLGIFHVNMPLLYGEGRKAFQRLQEEIIRTWTRIDHSILVWNGQSKALLASSPSQFPSRSAQTRINIYGKQQPEIPDIVSWSLPQNQTFELSSKGLRISLYARPHIIFGSVEDPEDTEKHSEWLMVALNCSERHNGDEIFALVVKRRRSIILGREQSQSHWKDQQADAMYDFQPGFTTVATSALSRFTLLTLTIARSPYPVKSTFSQIRIDWQSTRFPVERSFIGEMAGRSCTFACEKLVFGSSRDGKPVLAFRDGLQEHRSKLNLSMWHNLDHYHAVIHPDADGDPIWNYTYVEPGNKNILLPLGDKPILSAFANSIISGGKITLHLIITDLHNATSDTEGSCGSHSGMENSTTTKEHIDETVSDKSSARGSANRKRKRR